MNSRAGAHVHSFRVAHATERLSVDFIRIPDARWFLTGVGASVYDGTNEIKMGLEATLNNLPITAFPWATTMGPIFLNAHPIIMTPDRKLTFIISGPLKPGYVVMMTVYGAFSDAKVTSSVCRACSECEGDPTGHHFSESTLESAYDEGDDETPSNKTHPAALAGHEMWFGCKHCDAWAEIVDDDCSEVIPGAVHEPPGSAEKPTKTQKR